MDPVKQICDELAVCREEALYYLEGFQWELDLAMKACRDKTLPSLTVKSSSSVSVNESDVPSMNPPSMEKNSPRISNRTRIMPERLPPLRIMRERQPPLRITPERQPPLRIMPKQPPPQLKEELIEAFCSVALGTYREDALHFLDRSNWDVNTAVGQFMDERRPMPGKSNRQRSSVANWSSEDYLPMSAQEYLKDSSKDVLPMVDWSSLHKYAEDSSKDDFSVPVAVDVMKNKGLPSPSQFDAPVVYRKQDYLKEDKIGSSSSSTDVCPIDIAKPFKEPGEEHFLVDIPVTASSQVNVIQSPTQFREETLSLPMDTWVDRICDETKVSRDEALYYLEGFNWNLGAAMEACRCKTLPPVKEASSLAESAEAPPNLPGRPSQLNDKIISLFCDAAVGATREDAIAYLKLCNGDVNQAVGLYIDKFSNEELFAASTMSLMENRDLPLSFMGLPSQSQFEASLGYLNEDEFGSSSSSTYADLTETEGLFEEATEENVSVAMPRLAPSRVEAVEEDSSMETSPIQDRIIVGPRAAVTTITITIILADDGSGTSVDIPFRSNQTVRDIRDAIDQRTPFNDRDYYLESMAGVEYKDMNITVYRIFTGGSTTLLQVFPDP